MKQSARLLVVVLAITFISLLFPKSSFAQRVVVQPASGGVNVGGQVGGESGQYFLNIDGFASPYASIIMTVDGVFLTSTVADAIGNFSIRNLTVAPGFDHFCLQSVDFKRLGVAEACPTITPVYQQTDLVNIYIPPTIGVLRSQINAGENGLVRGYTMPNAKVNLTLKSGDTYSLTADGTGYYEYTVDNPKAGIYVFTSDGEYKGIKSYPPTRNVVLEVLSTQQQVKKKTQKTLDQVFNLLTTGGLWFLVLLLILLIIIIILLLILRPRWLMVFFDKFYKKKIAHHDWFLKRLK